MNNYWTKTADYLKRNGTAPSCPDCGATMFPADDHGRFTCMCNLGGRMDGETGVFLQPLSLPQIDTTGMSDAEKTAIPPINRLNSTPTEAERQLLNNLSAEFGLPGNF